MRSFTGKKGKMSPLSSVVRTARLWGRRAGPRSGWVNGCTWTEPKRRSEDKVRLEEVSREGVGCEVGEWVCVVGQVESRNRSHQGGWGWVEGGVDR